MMRSAIKQFFVIALLAGLVLRALIPLGYMPAAPGTGLLFELCPDRFPAGFLHQDAGASTHHHHGSANGAQQSAEPDQCQIGHLLFSAVAVDQAMAAFNAAPDAAEKTILPIQTFPHRTVSVFRARGPPLLSNQQINI